jgi:hypothetical protein
MYSPIKNKCDGNIFFFSEDSLESSSSTSNSTITSTVLAVISSTERRTSFTSELLVITVTSLRASSYLAVGSRNNLSRESKVGPQVLNTLSSKVHVVVLPVEGNTNVSPGLEGLHEAKYLKVGRSLNVGVGSGNSVLLYNKNTLTEEVLVYCNAVCLGDKHDVVLIVRLISKMVVQHEKLLWLLLEVAVALELSPVSSIRGFLSVRSS